MSELYKYSATSIVEAAMRLLWAEYPSRIEALQTAPWHILLLVKWTLADSQVTMRVGKRITPEAFDGVRQMVQDLVGSEFRTHPPQNTFLMLRAHFLQFDFQRKESWGFLRWPALISREPNNHPSQRQFLEHLGLSPEHYMDLAFGLHAAVLARQLPLAPSWFESLRPVYGASVDAIWKLVARDFPTLRSDLMRDVQTQRLRLHQELYEFPFLKRYPFYKMRNGHYQAWHPLVLARGLEEIVHLKLTRLQGDYTEPFSRIFERYVWELASTMSATTIVEDTYANAVGAGEPTVEAVIPFGDCNVFIEAKMSLFGDDVLLTDNESQAYQKTKRVREGIKQGWKVGKALRQASTPFPVCSGATQDFLLLVTSRELYLGSGEKLLRLYRPAAFDYPDVECRNCMPFENAFILSVESYERLCIAVAGGKVSLPTLLKEAVAKNRDPSTSAIFFDDFIRPYVDEWGMTELLQTVLEAAQARLEYAFETQERH